MHALVRLGETERAGQFLAGLGEQDRDRGEIRIAAAALRLAQGDPHAALAALAPVLDGSAPRDLADWLARRTCWRRSPGTRSATPAPPTRALERALDLAEPDGVLLPFLLYPARACSSAMPGTAPPTPP